MWLESMYWKMQMNNISIAVESSIQHPFMANIYFARGKEQVANTIWITWLLLTFLCSLDNTGTIIQ